MIETVTMQLGPVPDKRTTSRTAHVRVYLYFIIFVKVFRTETLAVRRRCCYYVFRSAGIRIEIRDMELEHYNDLVLHMQDKMKLTKNLTETTETVECEHDSRTSMVDARLFKMIGLYQTLRPDDARPGGGFGKRYRNTMLAILSLIAVMQSMQNVRLYTAVHELQLFLYTIMIYINGMNCVIKMYVVITNVDGLWSVLDAARYRFTACGLRNPERLRRYRDTLSRWLRMFAVLNFAMLFLWVVPPFFVKEYVPSVKMDGTVGRYRATPFNWWYPVPERTYNWTPVWAPIYAVETFIIFLCTESWIWFDSYFMTMCFVLTAHFETLRAAYETLGRRQPSAAPSGNQIEIQEMELEHYNDLKRNIQDNMKLTKKFDEFLDIIRPMVYYQIFSNSLTMITLIYCLILEYKSSEIIIWGPIFKSIISYMLTASQLFVYCYSLNRLETAKSSLNFGLYSSNWTEMSLKFKKTLLLAMNINSAHLRVIRVSPNSIVNMEMFAGLMKTSYTIVSVLLNVT